MNPSLPTGRIAAAHPYAIPILERYGIDFCCGGAQSLAEACQARGVDPEAVLAEIEAARPSEAPVCWADRPLDELIAHIVEHYHRPLDELLPALEALLCKVVGVHGAKHPRRFAELTETFHDLKDDLEPHMRKEETILFPWLRSANRGSAGEPIRAMLAEHEAVAELLRRLRELTWEYTAPEEACASWRALWRSLAELEHSLHEHIHLENNILFPRALA